MSLPDEALDWLEPRVAGKLVLELGSGASTPKLSALCRRLFSVEHNPRYVHEDSPFTTYIEAPLVRGWYSETVLRVGLPKGIEAMVVHGQRRITSSVCRAVGFLDYLELFPPLVPVLLDDVLYDTQGGMALSVAIRRKQMVSFHRCVSGRVFATLGWENP